MPLSSGTRLGAYEITHALGAGGMGEVYRARDSKLGRSVAIKIILEPFAGDADRVARFEREARALASVNHPNIAALYGMEHAGGQHFLVMELVEGETLADRIQRGALPVDEAMPIALQIAEALEAAHERGIIHRDLKPANIKITPDHKVKVLDFGLAKAMDAEGATANVANSPTLSMMATNAGVVLGTAAYMSPEQAKGFAADHRSDVFSFGVVLYEMLTGRQPFQGETAPDILASVLVREPELNRLPADLNPRLPELLRRCLEKSPKRRWQAIGDVRAELESIAVAPRLAVPSVTAAPPKPFWRRAIPVVAAAVVTGALGAVAAWQLKDAPAGRVVRFGIVLPEGQAFSATTRRVVAISPDGRMIAYTSGGQLHVRDLSSLAAKPLQGTEVHLAAFGPVFSPDSQSIAFYALADRSIKKIAVSGGSAATICANLEAPFSMTWGPEGIVFTQLDGVLRVSANGGKPEKLLGISAEDSVQRAELLPGGKTVLFTLATGLATAVDRWTAARVMVHSLASGERKTLLEGGGDATYLPTGHLAYLIGGVLYAVPFDVKTLEVTGGPVPIVEGIRRSPLGNSGVGWFGVSGNGTLAYVPGPASLTSSQLDIGFVDRKGTISPLKLPQAPYEYPRISPDGKKIAVGTSDGKEAVVLIYDLTRGGALQRFTFGGKNRFPIWTHDSKRVVFQSDRDGDLGIFWQAADGTTPAERLTRAATGEAHTPESWSPRGEAMLYSVVKANEYTLWTYSVRDRKSAPFGGVRSSMPTDAAFSPDGKWVVYSSGATMPATTVYVQPFPATGPTYQLVKTGADVPHHAVWTPDGKHIVTNPRPANLDTVAITTQPTFAFGAAEILPKGFLTGPPNVKRPYDMAPDGRILGLINPGEARGGTTLTQVNVVLNWTEELKQRVPTR